MIYASSQWFLVLCVIGLSLKLEKYLQQLEVHNLVTQKHQETKVLLGYSQATAYI